MCSTQSRSEIKGKEGKVSVQKIFLLNKQIGIFKLKHNNLMFLSLFELTTRFGLCTGSSSGHKITRENQKVKAKYI